MGTGRGQDRHRPATLFLSYSHRDTEEVAWLQRELKARGIRPWSFMTDLQVGRYTDHEIKHVIDEQTDAALLYLSSNSLRSNYIWTLEIPWAQARSARDPSYAIIPVFRRDKLSASNPSGTATDIKDVADAECSRRGLRTLSEYNGERVPARGAKSDAKVAVRAALANVANRSLKSTLALRLHRVAADRQYVPQLCFRTFHFEPACESLDLDLDWTDSFEGRLPAEREWRNVLLPALLDVKRELSQSISSRTLQIALQASIPACLAFGFVCSETSRLTLDIEVPGGRWRTDELSSQADLLQRIPLSVPSYGDERVAVLQLAVSRPTSRGVDETLGKINLSYGHHLLLSPPDGPGRDSVTDGAHAVAIAKQVGREVIRLCNEGVQHIHLFAAVPAALAVFVGRQLNAVAPVATYQYEQNSGIYVPQCILKAA